MEDKDKMSSSSVCQGLQSCLEPRLIEPRVLRLKLAPPGSNFSGSTTNNHDQCDKKDTQKASVGWSFLQALTDNNKTERNDNQVYVHPTVKRSSSMLSEKSLEMCTESLGSETGSNTNNNASESSDIDATLFRDGNNDNGNSYTNCGSKRVRNKGCSFPPPLSSMGGVHVRPHREGGRLILEAVVAASPSPLPYFHAERGDGRLRLHLLEGPFDSDDDEDVAGATEEGGGEEGEERCCGAEEELEESVDNVEDEVGVTKFARPSRCKESGNLATLRTFPLFLSVSE